MVWYKNYLLLIFCGLFFTMIGEKIKAQEANYDTLKNKVTINNLSDFGKQSHWSFRSRSFFMSTLNNGALKDDYTLAQGAGIGLLTIPIKGFQMGFSGYYIFNVASSKIAEPDSITGNFNRYEIGQYDVTNLKNKNLARFEDLFLKYNYKKSYFQFGRMEINTPFMNAQDGRMRPTYVEGALLHVMKNEKYSIDVSYIWRMSPRSTFHYYLLKDATGLYGQGNNIDGSKSNYRGNISTNGFYTGHIFMNPIKNFQIHIWNGYFEHVMNTVMIEMKNEIKRNENSSFYKSFLMIHQNAIGNGGNENASKTYINKGNQSNAVSLQLGFKNKKLNTNINYTHITGDGRYLMPREWGRDPFYTFLPRERNEGAGLVHAVSSNLSYLTWKEKLKLALGYGYYLMPSVSNSRLNKYGMPSYHQINLVGTYQFQNALKGMELRLLAVGKLKDGNDYLAPKYQYNKVNMINLNLILDIKI
jgi:hypothetical protein